MSRINFIQILISIITTNKLKINQIDVKMSFLSGNLNKEIYIVQLQVFVVKG